MMDHVEEEAYRGRDEKEEADVRVSAGRIQFIAYHLLDSSMWLIYWSIQVVDRFSLLETSVFTVSPPFSGLAGFSIGFIGKSAFS
jgi:hypothetical protein